MSPIRVTPSDACTICHALYLTQNEHHQLEDCVQLDCTHIFHEKCLKQWYAINPSCPQCRKAISLHSIPEIALHFQMGTQTRCSIIAVRTMLVFFLCFHLTSTVNLYSNPCSRDLFKFAQYLANLFLMVVVTILALDIGSESQGETRILRRGAPLE